MISTHTDNQLRLDSRDFRRVGKDLSRPECVLARPDGSLLVSDQRAAYTLIRPDGTSELVGEKRGLPNGMCMIANGDVIIADIEAREIYSVDPTGRYRLWLSQFEGRPLGAANFIYRAPSGRLYATISTDEPERQRAVRERIKDGYILDITNPNAPFTVYQGFCFTNEMRIREGRVYVAETGLGRIVVGDMQTGGFAPYISEQLFEGARVDGIIFDKYGNLWVTELERNSLHVLTAQGEAICVFEDPAGAILDSPTSLCFVGDTAIVGSLTMDSLIAFKLPDMRH